MANKRITFVYRIPPFGLIFHHALIKEQRSTALNISVSQAIRRKYLHGNLVHGHT